MKQMRRKYETRKKEVENLLIQKIRKRVLKSSSKIELRARVRTFTESSLAEIRVFANLRMKLYRCLYQIGEGGGIGPKVRFHKPHRNHASDLIIGNQVWIGADTRIDYSGGVTIGNYVSISDGAVIYTHDHSRAGKERWIGRNGNKVEFYHLRIADNAWIGSQAVILPKATYIGKGANIAAGSVVRNNVPDNAIVAGNPAKIVGYVE